MPLLQSRKIWKCFFHHVSLSAVQSDHRLQQSAPAESCKNWGKKSRGHIYFCHTIIYFSLGQSWLSTLLLQWPAAICFKVTPGDWTAHPHIASQSRDLDWSFWPSFCLWQQWLYTKHAWTHLTKSILLLIAAQWRSVTFSLSGCRTSKPASTNSLQRSKMPYLRIRGVKLNTWLILLT